MSFDPIFNSDCSFIIILRSMNIHCFAVPHVDIFWSVTFREHMVIIWLTFRLVLRTLRWAFFDSHILSTHILTVQIRRYFLVAKIQKYLPVCIQIKQKYFTSEELLLSASAATKVISMHALNVNKIDRGILYT